MVDLDDKIYNRLDLLPMDREISPDEATDLLQLGVNILSLTTQGRHKECDAIWDKLGFDQCVYAMSYANSVLEHQLPEATI